jgi:ABC-type polysaccharide/polyol phosphate transport system ATPase subunit
LTGEPAIHVSGVSKTFLIPHQRPTRLKEVFVHPFRRQSYERNHALDDVSFEVTRGEFFGIVGPNGSGKSTLLKILARIYRADAGSIRVNGRIAPFIELGVGFNYEMTARENIEINGVLLGLTRAEIAERFDAILAFAELERYVDQQLKNFSSGMLLRLAYSIAIQVPFEILLLDEVLAVGDERFQQKCFATFDQFHAEGRTVLLVSHNLDSVTRFCDRALYLLDGRVQSIGPACDVVEEYRRTARVSRLADIRA